MLMGLLVLGGFFGGVALPFGTWVALAAWLIAVGLPFAAFSLFSRLDFDAPSIGVRGTRGT